MRLSQDVVDLLRNPESPDGLIRDALLDMGLDVAKVYVVCGSCGSYSDQRSWTVAAFLDEGQARAFCGKLNQWCRDNRVHSETRPWPNGGPIECPLDPEFKTDSDGTSYEVEAIPLRVN
jgi:hypothetical protein